METEMNWEMYFPIPNDRNKERLNYYIDKRLVSSDNALYREILLLSKKIINDIPEKYLCRAFVDYNYGSSILLWSSFNKKVHLSSFSIEYNIQGFEKENIGLLLWKFLPTEEDGIVGMTMISFIEELNEDSYSNFLNLLITNLKIYYGEN